MTHAPECFGNAGYNKQGRWRHECAECFYKLDCLEQQRRLRMEKAAPDMLEALKVMVDQFDDGPCEPMLQSDRAALSLAEQAIAKAEGNQ